MNFAQLKQREMPSMDRYYVQVAHEDFRPILLVCDRSVFTYAARDEFGMSSMPTSIDGFVFQSIAMHDNDIVYSQDEIDARNAEEVLVS